MDAFMGKEELAQLLSIYADKVGTDGQIIAMELLECLNRLVFKPRDNILVYLPVIIADAVEEDANLPQSKKCLHFVSYNVSSVTRLLPSEAEQIERFTKVGQISEFLEKLTLVTGYAQYLRAYWDAEYNALWVAGDRFKRLVWKQGLFSLVRELGDVSGYFGRTKLSVNVSAGLGVVFSRGKKAKRKMVYFIGDESNCEYFRVGAGPEASLGEALVMIDEVIAIWPEDPEKQKRSLKKK